MKRIQKDSGPSHSTDSLSSRGIGEPRVTDKGLRLFKVFGFQVSLDRSWIILALLVAGSLAMGYFPSQIPNLTAPSYWLLGITGALGLFFSIIVHELFHSLVGRLFGMPISGIKLFIFGGIAEMREEPPSPRAEFFMAAAGPVASVLIAVVFGLLQTASVNANWGAGITALLGYLAAINAIVAIFNLLPGFPMDGGRILRSILWAWKKDLKWATRIASNGGTILGYTLIALGVLQFFQGGLIGGIWLFLIGLFLQNISKSSYRQLVIKEEFAGIPLSQFAHDTPVSISPEIKLNDLVEDYFYRYYYQYFPVTQNQELLGCVKLSTLKTYPKSQWSQLTAQDVMEPCRHENTIEGDLDVIEALRKMQKTGNDSLMIVRDSKLIGIITSKDLANLISLHMNLESQNLKETVQRYREAS